VFHCTTISNKDANRFGRAQAGDRESVEQLMRTHEGLVHHIVRQQWCGCLSYEEAAHAGRIGLWRAILGFDPERGNAFSTYASVAIARHVWRAVAGAEREDRVARTLASTTSCLDPGGEVLAGEVEATLYAMVERLPPKERWVVCTYYGLDGWGGCTLAQLGRRLGCSRQAVHYHLRKALLRLRHPAFSALLRAMLGRNRRMDYLRALRAERRGP
jgi:RNA polymerase sigma factor (sigma-70 family)